ncbi:MAG: hypothetical protein QMD77_05195 [Patescibacteria group bacterium]|nr:hypothetical protein [Patescibacteria group bacterium]
MNSGSIENPFWEKKEAKPKMGKKKRLPETGEGNKPVEIWGPKDGRVEIRVLGTYITLGYTVRNDKFKGHVISREQGSRVYDAASHDLPGNLEEKAIKQGFARLREEAEEKYPILRERKRWKEHGGKQPDLL